MTFKEIQDAVADWMNRDDLATRIPSFINHAQLSLERKFNFEYMERMEPYVSVTTHTIPAPLDYKNLHYAHLLDSSGNRRLLTKKDVKATTNLYPNYTTHIGTPIYISTIEGGRTFLLRPTPDGPYDIDLYYYAKSTPLVDDSDVNWLTENAPDVLVYGALLNSEPFMVSQDLIAYWQAKFNEELSAIGYEGIREGHLGSYQTVTPYGDVV